MTTHTDDRESLEPGAGLASAPAPVAEGAASDPFAGYGDYYGFDETERWYFPDQKQWIEFKKMNEGMRSRFQSKTRPDVIMHQRTGEARIPFDQAKERHELILLSAVDWHVIRRGPKGVELVPFSTGSEHSALGQWLKTANPALVMDLEKAIRKANPWILQEMPAEQIEKEIESLQEQLAEARKREAREQSFQATS